MAPRPWLRTCSPRSATASATDKMASERSRSAGELELAGPKRGGKVARQATASVDSPFITDPARSRCGFVESASRAAAPPQIESHRVLATTQVRSYLAM